MDKIQYYGKNHKIHFDTVTFTEYRQGRTKRLFVEKKSIRCALWIMDITRDDFHRKIKTVKTGDTIEVLFIPITYKLSNHLYRHNFLVDINIIKQSDLITEFYNWLYNISMHSTAKHHIE